MELKVNFRVYANGNGRQVVSPVKITCYYCINYVTTFSSKYDAQILRLRTEQVYN